jgi:hypothetical protein
VHLHKKEVKSRKGNNNKGNQFNDVEPGKKGSYSCLISFRAYSIDALSTIAIDIILVSHPGSFQGDTGRDSL